MFHVGWIVASPAVETVTFGEFEAKLATRELCRNGVKVRLPDQSFQILAMLLERRGELVPREVIRQRLWPADTFVDFDHGLNNAVNRLREVLGDSANSPRFIETLPRRGYRFIAPVDCGSGSRPESIRNSASIAQATGAVAMPVAAIQVREPTRPAVLVSISLALVLIVVSVAALFIRPTADVPRIQSLLVLPFENVSGDPTQEYFADGVTDALITNLARLNSMRVISRTSAMHYKNSHPILRKIARELDVDAVVEGTVSKTGGHVRINAQLIDARNDRHIWAETYERDIRDIGDLQSELATTIADRVVSRMAARRQSRSPMKQINPEAYEAYLKGRYFWNKRTEEGLYRSISFFEQAVKMQPDYAQAYTGLSDAYALLGFAPHAQFSRNETMARARAAALKALEIDDRAAEGHTSLASISMIYDWNWPLAEKEFQRALELDPSYATAHHWYAFYCASQRRTEDALAEIRIAQKLDPLSIIINADVAHLLYFSRRYDEAIAQVRRTLEMDPNLAGAHVTAGLAYLAKRQYPQSVVELEAAVRISNGAPDATAFLGLVYAQSGRRDEARRVLRKVRTGSFARHDPVLKVAWIYAALGDRKRAFAWAEGAYQARSPEFYTLAVLPALDPFRSDPRFEDLMRRIGLAH